MAIYPYKQHWASEQRQKRINWKRKRRLEALQFSRQLSDKEVCDFIGMNLEHWEEFKRGNEKLREKYEAKLIELFGEEIIYIFMGYYVNPLSKPKVMWANDFLVRTQELAIPRTPNIIQNKIQPKR